MSEAKFTPGPWCRDWIYGGIRHLNKNVDYESFWSPDEEEANDVDEGRLNIPNVRVNPADARLIAAAPDLYAALRAIDEHWQNGNHSRDPALWEPMKAALAKAAGR